MPKQEVFLKRKAGKNQVEVVKTYDQSFAQEAFSTMDEQAQLHLLRSLGIQSGEDSPEIPAVNDADFSDFLWDELTDAAREYGNESSFFVVMMTHGSKSDNLYVSPDWPSAEAFCESVL